MQPRPRWLIAALFAACVTAPAHAPATAASHRLLLLPPAGLGRELALTEHLRFTWAGRSQEVDAVVEVDTSEVRVAFLVAGQRVARLAWDGAVLASELAPGVPPALVAPEVISDLQLTHWPAPAIAAALPAGTTLEDDGAVRRLRAGGAIVVEVETRGDRSIITNHALGYRVEVFR